MDAATSSVRGASPSVAHGAASRLDWLDAAKGIGICLVVAGHAIGGVMSLSLPGKTTLLPYAYAFIYTFHMDLFFFLSGLTVAARLARKPGDFVRKNFTRIAYAYVIWSIVQYSVIYLVGNLANNPLHDYDLSVVLTGDVSQFWFLYVLFFLNLLAYGLVPRIGAMPLLLAALAARPFSALFAPGDNIGHGLHFALPYVAGVALGAWRLDTVLRDLKAWHVGALALFALGDVAIFLSPVFGGMPQGFDGQKIIDFVYSMQALPSALLLSATVLVLSACVAEPLRRGLATLGRLSLPIYILHIMCIAGTRIMLDKFLHVSNIWLILAIIVPCGVIVPVVGVRVLDRLRLARPLGLI